MAVYEQYHGTGQIQTQTQNHYRTNAHGIFTNYCHCDPPLKSTKTDRKSQGDRVQREEKEEEEGKKKKKKRRETAGLNRKEGEKKKEKKKRERNKICFLKRRREINMHELP